MKARNRPPRLEVRTPARTVPKAPTVADLLVRAKIAGRGPVGPRELRRSVDRLVAGDAGVLGGVGPLEVSTGEAWAAVATVYGAGPDHPEIEPGLAAAATATAVARVADCARAGATIAFATSWPASMLPLYSALARKARAAGGEITVEDDAGPVRVDGRSPRWIRWFDGVAAVTDGRSILGAHGPDAAVEWLFAIGRRPAVVVADGWFAESAYTAGSEVVAFGGLERIALAVPAARRARCWVVPVHPGRSPRAYAPLAAIADSAFG